MFSYSSCHNNPGSDGTWSSLACNMGNTLTGMGYTIENGIGAIGNTISLGEIVVNE